MEDLDYLEEEEDLMVVAAVALVALMAAALVDALTATMDLGGRGCGRRRFCDRDWDC